MIGRMLVAVALAGAAAVTPAAAGQHVYDCGYDTVGDERVTDGRYRGIAYGWIAGAPGEEVAISCVLKVDGVVRAATPTASGPGAAATAGRVAVTARPGSHVALCAVATVHGATEEQCYETTSMGFPPQEVSDPAHAALYAVHDPAAAAAYPVLCAALARAAGTYGPVTVGADGDVTEHGETWRDCPPSSGTARADGELDADCGFHSVAQDDVTGGVYEGAGYGYLVAGPDDEVTVSCVLYVNGSEVLTTPPGSGRGAAVTAGRVTFAAGDTDSVQLCLRSTVNGVAEERCYFHGSPLDLVWRLAEEYGPDPYALDPVVCPVLGGLAGEYGPVTVTGQGDVYAAGEPQWDCPPYDIWPPA